MELSNQENKMIINNKLPKAKYHFEFDILRSLAILYVIAFWHLCTYGSAIPCFRNDYGYLMTSCILGLFVFMSGFLFSERYEINSLSDIISFLKKRLVRIYPMFFISLTIFLALNLIDFKRYLISVLLLNMILNQDLLTLWFITLIFLFYLITPFYLYKYNLKKVCIWTLIIYISLILINLKTNLIDLRLPQYLLPFVFGIISPRILKLEQLLKKQITVILALLIFVLLIKLLSISTNRITHLIITDLAILASIPIFLFIAKIIDKFLVKIKINNQVIKSISYSSFAMFLIHRIVFEIGFNIYEPQNKLLFLIYSMLILIPIVFILSLKFQKYYDTFLSKAFKGN